MADPNERSRSAFGDIAAALGQTLASPPIGSFADVMRRIGSAGAAMLTTPLERPIVDELGNVHYGGKEVPPGGRPATRSEQLKTLGDYADIATSGRGGIGQPKVPRPAGTFFNLSRFEKVSPEAKEAAKEQAAAYGKTPTHAETRLVDIERTAPVASPESGIYNVTPETRMDVPPGTAPSPLPQTPGQPTPRGLLGPRLYEAQQEEALRTQLPKTREKQLVKLPGLAGLAEDIAINRPPAETMRRLGGVEINLAQAYEFGKQLERWYVGTYPQLKQLVRDFYNAAPASLRGRIDVQRDPVLLAKNIAATSPATAPYDNVGRAINAFIEWLEAGRPKDYVFGRGGGKRGKGFESHTVNLGRAIRGEPLEGQKISNYLLDALGSEWNVTIDRWMVNLLLDKPSKAATVTRTEYELAARRMLQLADHFGTTPARLQAAMWTGTKMLADPRIYKLLAPDVVRTGTGWMNVKQAVPALGNLILYRGQTLAQAIGNDPKAIKMITPPVILAGMLLDMERGQPITPSAPTSAGPPIQ